MRGASVMVVLAAALAGCGGLGLWSSPQEHQSSGSSSGSGSGSASAGTSGSTSSSSTSGGTTSSSTTGGATTTTGGATTTTTTSSTSTSTGTTGVVTTADVSVLGDMGTLNGGDAYGVAVGSDGTVWASDLHDNQLVRIASGQVTVVAGGNGVGHQDGAGARAVLASPYGVALVGTTLYFIDSGDGSGSYAYLRTLDTGSLQVSTICGSGLASQAQNGDCSVASFDSPEGIAYFNGAIYVCSGNLIQKVDLGSHQVSTWAGSSQSGSANANGINARFAGPSAIAADAAGNLYVADYTNDKVRKIDTGQNVTTFATLPEGNPPFGIAVDAQGNVYASDVNNSHIFRWSSDGTLTADVTDSAILQPVALAVDSSGHLIVGNAGNTNVLSLTIP